MFKSCSMLYVNGERGMDKEGIEVKKIATAYTKTIESAIIRFLPLGDGLGLLLYSWQFSSPNKLFFSFTAH